MTSTREQIYSALYELLKSAVDGLNFKTTSRKTRIWSQVPPEEQPALFMRQVDEESILKDDISSVPSKWILRVDVPIYVWGGEGDNDSPMPLMNNALDAIEKLFPPAPRLQRLGLPGVSSVRIVGKIDIGEGTTSAQAIAIVPIRIVAT